MSMIVFVCVQLVLVEVLGHEFNVTLHATKTVADVCNMDGCIYAFDISSTSPSEDDNHTTTADEASGPSISIIALSCDTKKSRRFA